MKPDRDDKKMIALILMWAVILTIIMVSFSSCKEIQYVTVPETHEVHDTIIKKEVVEKEVIKEVTVKDSVSFQAKGDTIYISRYRYERDYTYEKFLQAKIDSLSHVKADSIPYPVPYEVRVPAELSSWQVFFIMLGKICAVIMILTILFVIIKRRFL